MAEVDVDPKLVIVTRHAPTSARSMAIGGPLGMRPSGPVNNFALAVVRTTSFGGAAS
jgi:hypothetical protein